MRNKFDEQLKNLNDEMIKMGTMIEAHSESHRGTCKIRCGTG